MSLRELGDMIRTSGDAPDGAAAEFAARALESLGVSSAAADPELLRRWFVPAFNHWYCPAVRRGYQGMMAPVFDLGMLLCEPAAITRWTLASEQGEARRTYGSLLEEIGRSPLMARARRILQDPGSQEKLPQRAWLLLESLIRALDGVWIRGAQDSMIELPWLKLAEGGQTVAVYKGEGDVQVALLPLRLDGTRDMAATYPQLAPEARVTHLPDRLRVFAAYEQQAPNALDRLDYEVVEACLRGPNMRAAPRDPPAVRRTETTRYARSILPGTDAGVTRAEVKLPEDPPIHILPSELAPVKEPMRDADALFLLADILLNRKPLVYKRENPRDLVPKHRALVCFVTGAGAEGPPAAVSVQVHPYRHAYVYAKRQTFDLVRDLREALEQVRALASVDVDVAVFGLRRSQGDTVTHSKFALDQMPVRGDSNPLDDRQEQLEAFHQVAQGYFDRLPAEGRSHEKKRAGVLLKSTVGPPVASFLSHQARSMKPYHIVHLVLIGSLSDLPGFITVVGRYSGFEVHSRQYLTLIGVDLTVPHAGGPILIKGEPRWLYGRSRTVGEAATMLARGQLSNISLDMLRRQFVESVLGRMKSRSSGVQNQIRLAP